MAIEPPPRFVDVSGLLAPRSIAVIGASDQPGNLGGVAIRMLQKFRYPGSVWPVNPGRDSVHGLRCFARARDLPQPADLALLATGAESIPSLVRECAAAGIRCGIAWAGGFSETGTGTTLQDDLAQACRETGFALAGPNCIGIIDTHLPMTASFASFLTEAETLPRGDISMISQSGGTATMAQAFAQRAGFGFRYMISSGNEAVVTAADYIHALVEDPRTRVIAAYLEGIRNGPALVRALDEARVAGKPVVVLKGGVTEASARAAVAHTGALAGAGRVWEAVLRDAGALQVDTLEELLDHVLFLSSTDLAKLPAGRGIAAVTFGGGGGVLAADQAARYGLALPTLTASTRDRLRELVPPIAAIDNPIDLTPQVYNRPEWLERFPQTLDVIASDPGIDALLLMYGPMARGSADIARESCAFSSRTEKTVCFAWPLAPRGVPEYLRAQGMHSFDEFARALRVLARLARRREALDARDERASAPAQLDLATIWPVDAPAGVISEPQCHRILARAGLAVAAGRLVNSEHELAAAGAEVGWPVAMKGVSAQVTHRAAAGLVELRLDSEAAAREAYRVLFERAATAGVELDGVYVQHMVSGGTEVLVSAFRDPVFGVMISCGAGGVLTELLDDVVLHRAPVSAREAAAMIDRLRLSHAKQAPGSREALAQFIARFSHLAASAPWPGFVLEVNPVKWTDDAAIAVDGLLVIEAGESEAGG